MMHDHTEQPCHYCGLPVSLPSASAPGAQIYCCYGCRVAASIAGETGQVGGARWQLIRLGLAIFFTMNVVVFALALWSWDIYEADGHHVPSSALYELLRYTSLFLASLVVVLLAAPLVENAMSDIGQGRMSVDLLIVVGVLSAYGYSIHSVLTLGRHTYFEVACMVLVSMTLGRWLEAEGKLKTTRALRSLEQMLPSEVRKAKTITGAEEVVPLAEVRVGDLLIVRPGERIPIDGVVRRGQAALDERIVTGESTPSIKEFGDSVYAGSLNQDGILCVEATAAPNAGAISRIVDLVSRAATDKGRIEALADRAAAWFVPGVALAAAATLAIHWQSGFATSVMTALAVLLIACPCALGIATPLAVWSAIGRAASHGVLCRRGDALQELAQVKAVCFDKTGTLTTGESRVCDYVFESGAPSEQFWLAAMATSHASNHPYSAAVHAFASGQLRRDKVQTPESVEERSGRGVVAELEGSGRVALGGERLMNDLGWSANQRVADAMRKWVEQGTPLTCLGWDGRIRGAFAMEEEIREDVREVLAQLREDGFYIEVLTGDHSGRGSALAELLQVRVVAELTPEQKVDEVQRIQREVGRVAMVGDGINDAPALATADVGISMGCGADVTRESAPLCLLGNNLTQVRWSIALARKTLRTIRQNLFWAFAYNTVGIGLAIGGLLNPIAAAVAMVGSSLYVIGNSLRLAETDQPESGQLTPHTEDLSTPVCAS